MIKFNYIVGIIASACILTACEEETYEIGTSLTTETDKLDISSHNYYATTRTLMAGPVLSKSTVSYLGQVKDPETGTYVKSEFSTQLNILETMYVSPEDSLVGKDANGRAIADSCDLVLFIKSPFKAKDSLTAMKMRVSELDAPIPEGQNYYSDFDPSYLIRQDGMQLSKMFTYADLTETDSAKATTTYLNRIRLKLDAPYTSKEGTTYGADGVGSGYGSYILQQYFDHPEYFKNSYSFIHNVCPGFFFEIVDGMGFHAQIYNLGLRTYYRVKNDTTISNAVLVLAGTTEVLQTNKVTNDQQALAELAADQSCTYLKSPAGLFTEVTLPVDEIKSNEHANDSLVSVQISFQRYNNEVKSDQAFDVPASVLMVQKDSLTTFFENSKLIDRQSSFIATNSNYNTYDYTNIATLVTLLWNEKQKGLATDSQWTEKHPDWNKVVLVPVTPVYSTNPSTGSQTLTRIDNAMSLSSTKLAGGQTPIAISVVYAKFKNN